MQQYYDRAEGTIAEITMYNRRRVLTRICALCGDARYQDMDGQQLTAIRDRMAKTNGHGTPSSRLLARSTGGQRVYTS